MSSLVNYPGLKHVGFLWFPYLPLGDNNRPKQGTLKVPLLYYNHITNMKFDDIVAVATGILLGSAGLVLSTITTTSPRPQKSITISYVKLPPRPDRFVGDPEVGVE